MQLVFMKSVASSDPPESSGGDRVLSEAESRGVRPRSAGRTAAGSAPADGHGVRPDTRGAVRLEPGSRHDNGCVAAIVGIPAGVVFAWLRRYARCGWRSASARGEHAIKPRASIKTLR